MSTTERGFTLLELLVSLVVLGFLMVGLTQGVKLGLGAWNAQSRAVAQRDQLDAADRAIRRMIAHIDPGGEEDDANVHGEANRLDFDTELPSSVATATRRAKASILLDKAHRLIFRWSLHFHEQRIGSPPPTIDTELVSGVEQLKFSYWRPRDDTKEAGWRDDWSEPRPPALIKVHLVFKKDDPRKWPDIIVATALDAPSG